MRSVKRAAGAAKTQMPIGSWPCQSRITLAGEGEVVAAVMPPSEVRPVGSRNRPRAKARRRATEVFFFNVAPFDFDVAVAEAADVQIRVQVFDDVLVRGGREHADARCGSRASAD